MRSSKGNEPVEVDVVVKVTTDKAWGVLSPQCECKGPRHDCLIWVPKSYARLEGSVITLPQWMAEDKGLV